MRAPNPAGADAGRCAEAPHPPHEQHVIERVGWLRAAVLGANDGLVSTASLIAGVAAVPTSDRHGILVAGIAALVAGAMAMAAGEYVSVSSQSDAETADLAAERRELQLHPARELEELVGIWRQRGLDEPLARTVAQQLTRHDALGAHARDELGIVPAQRARPLQAALTSALTFALGAALPLAATSLLERSVIVPGVVAASLAGLVLLGAVGARAGGAPLGHGIGRVAGWGAVAMASTIGIGRLFGTVAG